MNALSACLAGLFAGWKALPSFLLLLEVAVHLLGHIFNLHLSIFVRVHWEAGVEVLLPEHSSLIFWLMCVSVVGFRPTDLVVLTPMAGTIGHVAVRASAS